MRATPLTAPLAEAWNFGNCASCRGRSFLSCSGQKLTTPPTRLRLSEAALGTGIALLAMRGAPKSHRRRHMPLVLGLAAASQAAEKATVAAATPTDAAVVFLHGSGDSGKRLRRYLMQVDNGALLQSLASSNVATVFPDSGLNPYTLMGGMPMAVWFDRTGLPPSAPEATASVEKSVILLREVLAELREEGIPPNRTLVGGFSMGGGIALQLGLRHPEELAGIFALSSYMCDDAAVFKQLEGMELGSRPPIFMAHGEADGFIRPAWGRATAERLKKMGMSVRFESLPRMGHELVRREIDLLRGWMQGVLSLDSLGMDSAARRSDL